MNLQSPELAQAIEIAGLPERLLAYPDGTIEFRYCQFEGVALRPNEAADWLSMRFLRFLNQTWQVCIFSPGGDWTVLLCRDGGILNEFTGDTLLEVLAQAVVGSHAISANTPVEQLNESRIPDSGPICRECAIRLGAKPIKGHCCTMYEGKCPVCGVVTTLAGVNDWCWPDRKQRGEWD